MDRLNFKRFRIDNWLVEPDLNQISNGREQVKLEPRTMDALVYLARHGNLVIRREELLEAVWADAFVTENTLSRTISRLRKALGDDWQKPRYVETVSKNGYRWISPVQALHPGESAMRAAMPAPAAAPVVPRRRPRPLVAAMASLVLLAAWALWQRPWRDAPPQKTIAALRSAVTLAGRQANPALSPDGRHIAFSWQGAAGDNWDVYVQSVGADNPQRLTTEAGPDVLPAWSPDGRFIAYVAGPDACGVYRVPLTGGPRVKLAECLRNPRHLAWSPDGARLAFDGRASVASPQGLFQVPLDGGPAAPILEPDPDSLGDWQPRYSPDGANLAFLRKHNADRHHLHVVDLENGTLRQITGHETGRIRGFDWTADGEALVYSYNRDGRFALWRIDLDSRASSRLPITDAWVTYPSLARDGSALIYKSYADVIDLWSLALDESGAAASQPERIVPSTRSELHPRLSPADNRLAFLSNRTGAFEVWSGAADRLIRHSGLEGLVPGLVDWDPTGARLVFDARRDGQSDLFLVEAESRAPQPLTQTAHNEVNPRFAASGATLYYGCDRGGDWQIWAMDLDAGTRRQLTQSGGYIAQADPAGKVLWFARLNHPGVFELDLATGEEIPIWSGLGQTDWGNWQVAKTGIYYLDRAAGSLMHQPFGGDPRVVHRAPQTVPYLGPAFHVSQDGRRLVFAQIAQSDDEIVIADYR